MDRSKLSCRRGGGAQQRGPAGGGESCHGAGGQSTQHGHPENQDSELGDAVLQQTTGHVQVYWH